MTLPPERVWRVFPWDEGAASGDPHSPEFVPPVQGQGRFDLPGTPAGVLYLAETAEHAVAEAIQHFRGQALGGAELRAARLPLALVAVELGEAVREAVVDLCDPAALVRLGLRPDLLASRDRHRTQAVAARLHASGHAGLRWWSALAGDWHTVALFRSRLESAIDFGAPEALTRTHAAVEEAARALGIELARG